MRGTVLPGGADKHLADLPAHYAEDRLAVLLDPVAVDGLVVMSSAAVLAAPRPPTAPEEHVPGNAPEPVPAAAPEERREPVDLRRRPARRSGPVRLSEEQLLVEARALDQAVLEQTGAPLSKRALKRLLHVGQPAANRIQAALADDRAVERLSGG